jgi:hypothetical protein
VEIIANYDYGFNVDINFLKHANIPIKFNVLTKLEQSTKGKNSQRYSLWTNIHYPCSFISAHTAQWAGNINTLCQFW